MHTEQAVGIRMVANAAAPPSSDQVGQGHLDPSTLGAPVTTSSDEGWRLNLVTAPEEAVAIAGSARRVAVLGIKTERQRDQPAFFVAEYLQVGSSSGWLTTWHHASGVDWPQTVDGTLSTWQNSPAPRSI